MDFNLGKGIIKVGERGQIVIPKKTREVFSIHPGDELIVLGDVKQGIGIVKSDGLFAFFCSWYYRAESNLVFV